MNNFMFHPNEEKNANIIDDKKELFSCKTYLPLTNKLPDLLTKAKSGALNSNIYLLASRISSKSIKIMIMMMIIIIKTRRVWKEQRNLFSCILFWPHLNETTQQQQPPLSRSHPTNIKYSISTWNV